MHRFRVGTIRARLLVGFVLVALLPAIAISTGSIIVGYCNGRQQALDRLESVAASKELQIADWILSLQSELVAVSSEKYAPERASIVLDLARNDKYYTFYSNAMRNRFLRFAEQSQQIQELSLLDLRGQVVLSTDVSMEGTNSSDQEFFQQGLEGPYTQLPFPSLKQDQALVIVAIPIIDQDGRTWGIIVGRADPETLEDILAEATGLGRSGKAYLVDRHHTLLRDSSTILGSAATDGGSYDLHTTGIDVAIASQANGSAVYYDYLGVPVVGAYRWLPDLQIALLAEQDLSEAFGAILAVMGVNGSIALVAVLFAVVASLVMTRGIARPLVSLAETATQIAAGDLDRVAQVSGQDEIGTLALAFNSMTAQLRDLINNLEQRVRQRTQSLQYRTRQLETSAQVSRGVTSILDIEDLLSRVADLIRDAFGYYRVHIYLVDRETNQLVLRANSGTPAPQHQRLDIGVQGLNGRVAQTNEAMLVNDVVLDAHYLPDQSLPDTRSELVVPLRIGDDVVGTLDVHSAEANALTSEDVLVVQSLGDQIAIAIENARLYRQAQQVATIEARQRLARELHDSVTQSLYSLTLLTEGGRRLARLGQLASPEDYFADLWEISRQSLKEMRLLVYELRPPTLEQEGLAGALQNRLDTVEGRAGVETRLLVEEDVRLSPSMEEDLYWIAQEALNNALKHAFATSLTMRLYCEKEHLVLLIQDDGQGFDPEGAASGGGIGLITMRERAESLGGTLAIHSEAGKGTTVTVTLEVPHD